jgi:hypothetical protein
MEPQTPKYQNSHVRRWAPKTRKQKLINPKATDLHTPRAHGVSLKRTQGSQQEAPAQIAHKQQSTLS